MTKHVHKHFMMVYVLVEYYIRMTAIPEWLSIKKPYFLIGSVVSQLNVLASIFASRALVVIFSFMNDFISSSFSQFLRDFCFLISAWCFSWLFSIDLSWILSWLLSLSTISELPVWSFLSDIFRLDYIQTYHHVSQGVWKALFQCHCIRNHIKSILWIYVRSRVLEVLDRLIYRAQFALSIWICVDSRRQMQHMLRKEKLWRYQASAWFRVSNFVQFLKQMSLVFFTFSNCTEVSCYVARQLSCIIECI